MIISFFAICSVCYAKDLNIDLQVLINIHY